jgi:hypothetical protein
MSPCKNYDPVHIAAASCVPHEVMWHLCQVNEISDSSSAEANRQVFEDSHAMVCDTFYTASPPSHRRPTTSTRPGRTPAGRNIVIRLVSMCLTRNRTHQVDPLLQDILRDYFRDPNNIVLHSNCPHITPHIVISPALETPEDFYTPWNNCTLPQWSGSLMVPPYDLTTGRLDPPTIPLFEKEDPLCASDDTLVNEDSKCEEISSIDKKHTFSHSRFDSFVSILHDR